MFPWELVCCYTAGVERIVIRQEELPLRYTDQNKGNLKVSGVHFHVTEAY